MQQYSNGRILVDLLCRLKPKSSIDCLFLVYALFLIHIVPFHCIFVVLPWKQSIYGEEETTSAILIYFTLAFLYINIMGNLWKIMTVNCTTSGKVLPFIAPEGWHYCPKCEGNSPPRSYHCQTCDRCILRRDHHCMFSGKCVGYFTYRHYVCLVFYCWIEAIIAAIFCYPYTWTLLGDFSIGNLFCAIFPMVAFVFRILDFYTMYSVLISTLTMGFSILLTFLAIYHSKHVYRGTTTYERRHNIYTYDLGFYQNLEEIFGRHWRISWICPFIYSPQPGDGFEFKTAKTFEDPKNL